MLGDEDVLVDTCLDGQEKRAGLAGKAVQEVQDRVALLWVLRVTSRQAMRQRVMIAMALVLDPEILIADEPTTALDVTVQSQILDLIRSLQEEHGTGVVLITHDLGVVAETADEVAVMYAGRIAERGPLETVLDAPEHPYTWGLPQSIPRLDAPRTERLNAIAGLPPSLIRVPSGCPFHPRCPYSFSVCPDVVPPLVESQPGHGVACHLPVDTRRRIGRTVRSEGVAA
jgi:peptide/nickel transport system ATP-binding protein